LTGLIFLDGTLVLQVGFATYQEHRNIRRGVLLDFIEPVAEVREGLLARNVKRQEHDVCASVKDAGDRTERLLASGIPDLQLYNFAV